MATNNLAPKSRNALLLEQAGAYPEYREVASFLGSTTPPVEFSCLGPGTRGEFSYSPAPYGQIRLHSDYENRQNNYKQAIPTLTHEMVHAATIPMKRLFAYENSPPTPEVKQFIEAYKKLAFGRKRGDVMGSFPRGVMAARIAGDKWLEDYAGYRSSEAELPSQAIGNAMRPEKDYDTPAHLDPTVATEYRILLDLATRAQNSLKGVK